MGRGRGRGRKIVTNGSRSHEDNNGEQVVPVRKRRGRPLKQRAAADEPDLANANNSAHDAAYHHQQQGGVKHDAELKENYSDGNCSKRNRVHKEEEEESSNNLDLEENSSSTNDESAAATRSSRGFRLNGSRRKSTPRRAAEAGI